MNKLTQDDILCQIHEQYMQEIQDSGIPAHIADQYGNYPFIINQEIFIDNDNDVHQHRNSIKVANTVCKKAIRQTPGNIVRKHVKCNRIIRKHRQVNS